MNTVIKVNKDRFNYNLKKFKYNGKIYSQTDLSKEVDNYGGNFRDMFADIAENGFGDRLIGYFIQSEEGGMKYYKSLDRLVLTELLDLGVQE